MEKKKRYIPTFSTTGGKGGGAQGHWKKGIVLAFSGGGEKKRKKKEVLQASSWKVVAGKEKAKGEHFFPLPPKKKGRG